MSIGAIQVQEGCLQPATILDSASVRRLAGHAPELAEAAPRLVLAVLPHLVEAGDRPGDDPCGRFENFRAILNPQAPYIVAACFGADLDTGTGGGLA